jgi:hypothetical protein
MGKHRNPQAASRQSFYCRSWNFRAAKYGRVHNPVTSADDLVFFLQGAGKLLWLISETDLAAAGYTPGGMG